MMPSTAAPDNGALTLEQKVGQLVMIDFSGPGVPDWLRESFPQRHWGGIILFAKNIESREQVAALCAELQAARVEPLPLLIGIDQEGGIVDRLPFDPLASSPGAMAFAAAGDTDLAREAARINGQELRSLGVNVNFAPCVDVNNNPLNPIIGVRAYGETAEQVSRFALEVARGFRAAGIFPCAKHFPGHGNTHLDSHLALPAVDADRAGLEEVELAPYRALIADGLEMIMTAHIVYPQLDPSGLPATLSRPILTDFLRGELGFEGVVITDSMSMKAVADYYGVGPAAVMAVQAGADIVLACGTPETHEETIEALLQAVRSGAITEARLQASLARIQRLKQAWQAQGDGPAPPIEAAEGIATAARWSVTVVRNDGTLPLSPESRVALIAPRLLPVSQLGEIAAIFPLERELQARGLQVKETSFSLAEESVDELQAVVAAAHDADVVLLCLYARGRLSAYQAGLSEALHALEKPVVVVSLNSPYILMDVPAVRTYVCTYGYARTSMQALADILCGWIEARGRLPVSIPQQAERGAGLPPA